MKGILFFLDKPQQDGIMESVNKEPVVKKYWFLLGMTFLCLLVSLVIGLMSLFFYTHQTSPETYAINLHEKTKQQLVVLPYPHQSFSNVSSWAIDAITSSYSFSFNDFDEQLKEIAYYYTPAGFVTFQNSLVANQIRESVVGNKLQISIVPTQDPVFVNMGTFGSTEFWRIRVPVLTSYFGGREPVVQRMLVEILVLRVPSYQNHKGLAIAEFNMTPM